MSKHKLSKQFKDDKLNQFKKIYYSEKDHFKIQNMPYWISNYSNKLNLELNNKLPRYYQTFKQGDVVMIDFGINVGSEMSGGHFGIVLNSKDDQYKRTITVVPLTSKLHKQHVSLGKNIVENTQKIISKKISEMSKRQNENIQQLQLLLSYDNDRMIIKEKLSDNNKTIIVAEMNKLNSLYSNSNNQNESFNNSINFLTHLKNFIKSMDSAESESDLAKMYFILDKEISIITSLNESINQISLQVAGLERLSVQLSKYNKESFAAISNITTSSKLRVRKFSEYDISGNISISDIFMKKIKISISNYIDL